MHNKIVDTRKYNKDKRAKLGRRGDTEIREVDGEDSHVNPLEASLIDSLGKSGEEYAKAVGAGTINQITGLKEYYEDEELYNQTGGFGPDSKMLDVYQGDVEQYGGMSVDEFGKTLDEFDIEGDDYKYIRGLDSKPYEFLQQDKQLGLDKIDIQGDRLDIQGNMYGMQERQLGSNLDFTNKQLGATKDFAMEGMQNQFSDTSQALGRQYRAGAKGALGQSQAMQAKSGLASSGSTQYGMQTQLKELTKGQAEGMGTARRNLDLGQRQTQSAYDLGTERAQSSYDFGMEGVGFSKDTLDLDRRQVGLDTRQINNTYTQGLYTEGQRQEDRLYEDLATINTAKGQDADGGKK